MKSAIVIGTGAGGAMAAKELQGHFQVTMHRFHGRMKFMLLRCIRFL